MSSFKITIYDVSIYFMYQYTWGYVKIIRQKKKGEEAGHEG